MKKLLLIILSITSLKMQAQQTTFEKVIYDASQTAIEEHAIIPSFNNGYLITGSQNFNNGFVLRLDSTGNTLWNRNYTNGNYMLFNAVVATNDSGYLVTGTVTDIGTNQGNIILSKINDNGDTLWNKMLGFTGYSLSAMSVIQLYDSSYFITGQADIATGPPYNRMVVANVDPAGNLLWMKLLTGGNWENHGYVVKQGIDSNLIVGGFIENGATPFVLSSCLVKISQSGILLWAKVYTPPTVSFCTVNDLEIINDGIISYMNAGYMASLMKTDFSGNIQWQKSYSVPLNSTSNFNQPRLHKTSDNGYLFSSGDNFGQPGFTTKTDSAGNSPWSDNFFLEVMDTYETGNKEFFASGNGPLIAVRGPNIFYPQIGIVQTDSVGSIGNCNSPMPVNILPLSLTDSTIIMTEIAGGVASSLNLVIDSLSLITYLGCVDVTGSVKENTTDNLITVEPNPSNGDFAFLNRNNEQTEIIISDIFGNEIFKSQLFSEKIIVDLAQFSNGVYCYKAISKNKMLHAGKLVIAK